MKKKIINGMLMAAFLFAGTTSFVSCKDNIDDDLVPIHHDLSTLDNKLKDLEETVLGHTTDIQNLRTDLTKLQNRVDANKVSIDSLALITKALDKKIDSVVNVLLGRATYIGVVGTVDPVLGEVRSALLDKNTLLGYIGKNDTKIDQFPIAGADYNVKGFEGTSLTLDEVDIDEKDIEELSGEKDEWLMNGNTFGRVYINVNPTDFDATKMSFSLIPSNAVYDANLGAFNGTSPVFFPKAYPSNKTLTLALGKKKGMDWEDFLADNEYAWNPESGIFPATWAIDAYVMSDDFDGMKFDWTTFNSDYVQGWKMADLMATIKEIWHNMMDSSKSRTDRGAETLKSVQGVLKAVADAIEYKRNEFIEYRIAATYDINKRKYPMTSTQSISNVAIEPLGYMAAVNFDDASDQLGWNFGAAKNLASKIYSKIAARFPDLGVSINLSSTGKNISVKLSTAIGATPAGTEIATISVDQIAADMNLKDVEDMVNNALKFYNRIKNGNAGNLVQRAENYMNRVTEQILDKYGNIATISVQPLVLIASQEANGGVLKLVDGLPTNTTAGEFEFVLTSLTGEYIVPVFKKYVAIEQDGKIVDYKARPGAQKLFSLNIPEGKSTLLVQCVDYTGRVITQKYPLNAVAE